jgi:hypothetical protein
MLACMVTAGLGVQRWVYASGAQDTDINSCAISRGPVRPDVTKTREPTNNIELQVKKKELETKLSNHLREIAEKGPGAFWSWIKSWDAVHCYSENTYETASRFAKAIERFPVSVKKDDDGACQRALDKIRYNLKGAYDSINTDTLTVPNILLGVKFDVVISIPETK